MSKKKLLSSYRVSLASLLLIGVYFLVRLVDIPFLVAIFGLILLYFLPGFLLNRLLGIQKWVRREGILGMAVVSSVATVNLTLLFSRSYLDFRPENQIGVVVVLSVILAIMNGILKVREGEREPLNYWLIFVMTLPLLAFLVRCAINPYIVDQDGAGYVTLMKTVERLHLDTTYLFPRRAGFTYIAMSAHYLTGLSFVNVFKYLIPMITWLSLGLLPMLITEVGKRKNLLIVLLGAVLLCSPALVGQVDRSKPESMMFLLNLPSVLLFFLAVKKKEIRWYLLGLMYSFVAFRSHDTGAFLLGIYGVSGLVWLASEWRRVKSYLNLKRIIIGLVILAPYVLLLHPFSFVSSLHQSLSLFSGSSSGGGFRWWYLGNYESDGVQLGWPGWTFILFYAYNGALVVLLALAALTRRATYRLKLTPVVGLIAVFFTVAEILPRFGYYYLPDRAWVELFYASSALLMIVVPEWVKRIPRWALVSLTSFLAINLIGGLIGTTALTAFGGVLASRSEEPALDYIRGLPSNSIILSSQEYNNTMVEIYTDKSFIPVKLTEGELSLGGVTSNLISRVDTGEIRKVNPLAVTTEVRKVTEQTSTFRDGVKVDASTKEVSTQETTLIDESQVIVAKDQPLYLLYSFEKVDGAMSKVGRTYWVAGIDTNHKDFFANLQGSQVVFRDSAAVLVRIR